MTRWELPSTMRHAVVSVWPIVVKAYRAPVRVCGSI
jgi:hypothetical protein